MKILAIHFLMYFFSFFKIFLKYVQFSQSKWVLIWYFFILDRAPKSWEFLMRLLVNTETNPSLIKWEDESQYTFRLVQPDVIVQIWNTKSDKASPNKDNFARSLRYHYKKGVLIPVPEKQLVYRCGPKAMEYFNNLRNLWRTF